MKTVYCIGEAVIDFTPINKGEAFKQNPGGAPANVAATVAKMGGNVAMITQVGDDSFGHFIVKAMRTNGIDTQYVRFSKQYQTSLAFVALNDQGERSFSFYRDQAADLMMHESDYDFDMFETDDVLHFCSVNLVDYPSRETHRKAIRSMKEQGGKISFDPNIRLPLWQDHNALYQTIHEFLPLADVIKISDEELFFITQEINETKALRSLLHHTDTIVIYTKGAEGIRYLSNQFDISVKGTTVEVVDTTGAGDASIGTILQFMQAQNFILTASDIEAMLVRANKVAGITCTQFGGMDAVPLLSEI